MKKQLLVPACLLALAVTAAVDVRRVEEGDARVECRVDHCSRAVAVESPAEVVAAEAEARDLEIRSAETPELHGSSLRDRGLRPRRR